MKTINVGKLKTLHRSYCWQDRWNKSTVFKIHFQILYKNVLFCPNDRSKTKFIQQPCFRLPIFESCTKSQTTHYNPFLGNLWIINSTIQAPGWALITWAVDIDLNWEVAAPIKVEPIIQWGKQMSLKISIQITCIMTVSTAFLYTTNEEIYQR